jgi:excisionase family DNA binding protein
LPASLELFTVAEAASILGVSRKLVGAWIRDGVLPAVRLGPGQRLLRIRRSDLEGFIARYQIVPPSQRVRPEEVEGDLGRMAGVRGSEGEDVGR